MDNNTYQAREELRELLVSSAVDLIQLFIKMDQTLPLEEQQAVHRVITACRKANDLLRRPRLKAV